MSPFSKPALPPAMAEYVSTLQPAGPASGAPKQTAYRLFRASDGKTRVDTGNVSIIHDPAAAKSIVLDHVKKEAHISAAPPQMPGMPSMPQIPGMPAMPQAPAPPSVQVQDLGKTLMQGQEVEGKRYTIQPPATPQLPQMPQMAKLPKMPQVPQAPQMPTVAEVWTSPHLQLPMATRVNGSFGQVISMCRNATPGEPHPAVFQIPQDYKQVLPAPPKLPAIPKAPA